MSVGHSGGSFARNVCLKLRHSLPKLRLRNVPLPIRKFFKNLNPFLRELALLEVLSLFADKPIKLVFGAFVFTTFVTAPRCYSLIEVIRLLM